MNHLNGIGSTWRRWDLHIHTPASIVQNYGGEPGWDRFLSELAALPPQLSVIGINDYLFIDGYRRVLHEWRQGRLPNIEAVFPVVEFRIRELAGVDGDIKRINFHAIFEPGIDPDIIEAQFLAGLSPKFQLTPDGSRPWSGFPSHENVAQFGAEIRATTPDDRRDRLPQNDLELGFNHLVVPLEHVRECLNHAALHGKAICAIGKTEWASLKWGDQSIATKKDLINGADIVFTAAATPADYHRSRQSLRQQGVNDRLLDCSDAHNFADSRDKDRLGNSMTWIRAQPTLDGLKHAITEFDSRVFIGEEPEKLKAVRARPGGHIKSVTIRKSSDAPSDTPALFDTTVELNPGFVAIVGNKGKGKSALLDVIGLAGNSSAEESFTFLSKERFRNPRANRASEHEVELTWCDGDTVRRRLDQPVPTGAPERVTYLPQRLLDEICSPDVGEPSERFSGQLGQVLFAHVPHADRLATRNLNDLIAIRTQSIDERLHELRSELSSLNEQIVEAEHRLNPELRSTLEQRLQLLKRRLAALQADEPKIPDEPLSSDPILQTKAEELRKGITACAEEIAGYETRDASLAIELDAGAQLTTAFRTLEQHVASFKSNYRDHAARLGLSIDDLVSLTLDTNALSKAIEERKAAREAVHRQLSPEHPSGPVHRKHALETELSEVVALMDQPQREYAAALQAHKAWQNACIELTDGTADEPGIVSVEAELAELERIPEVLAQMRANRADLVKRIHGALQEKVGIFEELYEPARRFTEDHPLARACELAFGASLRERALDDRFFVLISRGVAGTFTGLEEGAEELRRRVMATDFSDPEAVVAFTEGLHNALHADERSDQPVPVDAQRAVRSGHTLAEVYDLIFGLSYLEAHYSLHYRGIPIDQLSPGEKGTLLLMFYLLVDPGRTPLLLDQPDDNLDNHTIKELLVPAIKEAANRRQVVVVTHNPNVAIVADADQVIVAERDGERFGYRSGAIEDEPINLSAVDVLEGTWPAFDNRHTKYQRPTP